MEDAPTWDLKSVLMVVGLVTNFVVTAVLFVVSRLIERRKWRREHRLNEFNTSIRTPIEGALDRIDMLVVDFRALMMMNEVEKVQEDFAEFNKTKIPRALIFLQTNVEKACVANPSDFSSWNLACEEFIDRIFQSANNIEADGISIGEVKRELDILIRNMRGFSNELRVRLRDFSSNITK